MDWRNDPKVKEARDNIAACTENWPETGDKLLDVLCEAVVASGNAACQCARPLPCIEGQCMKKTPEALTAIKHWQTYALHRQWCELTPQGPRLVQAIPNARCTCGFADAGKFFRSLSGQSADQPTPPDEKVADMILDYLNKHPHAGHVEACVDVAKQLASRPLAQCTDPAHQKLLNMLYSYIGFTDAEKVAGWIFEARSLVRGPLEQPTPEGQK